MQIDETPLTLTEGVSNEIEFRPASPRFAYAEVTEVSDTAPVRLTVPSHGLVDGWGFWLTGAIGAEPLNRPHNEDRQHVASVIDADTLEINAVNGAGLGEFVPGHCYAEYLEPLDLAGASAVFVAEFSDGRDSVVLSSAESGNLEVSAAEAVIRFQPSAQALAQILDATRYSLSAETSDSKTVPVATGPVRKARWASASV